MTIYLKHPSRQDGEDWPLPPTRDAIASWEAGTATLPADYIHFMMSYNGGSVYPMHFDIGIDEEIADIWDVPDQSLVAMFFDWAKFVKTNAYIGPERKHMLQIGVDTDSSFLGLSPDGQVVHIWRNFPGAWDEEDDGPMPVTVLAPDFRSFLRILDDRDGVAPRWNLPQDLEAARIITF